MTKRLSSLFQSENTLTSEADVEEETNKIIDYLVEILCKETDKSISKLFYPLCRLQMAKVIDQACQKQLSVISSILSAEKLWRLSDGQMYFNKEQQQRIYHTIKSQRKIIYQRHIDTCSVRETLCTCMEKCKREKF